MNKIYLNLLDPIIHYIIKEIRELIPRTSGELTDEQIAYIFICKMSSYDEDQFWTYLERCVCYDYENDDDQKEYNSYWSILDKLYTFVQKVSDESDSVQHFYLENNTYQFIFKYKNFDKFYRMSVTYDSYDDLICSSVSIREVHQKTKTVIYYE